MPLHARHSKETDTRHLTVTTGEFAAPSFDVGSELDQARSADTAWRTERSQRLQQRIDRARETEVEGRRLIWSSFAWLVGGGLIYLLIWVPLRVMETGGDPSLLLHLTTNRTDGNPGIFSLMGMGVGVFLLVKLLLGLGLHRIGRARRHRLVRTAAKDYIEVTDPGDASLLDFEDLPTTL